MTERHVGLWLHSSRPEAVDVAVAMARGLAERGIVCLVPPDRADEMQARLPGQTVGVLTTPDSHDVELLVVLGGDGTILSAAEWALPTQ
ncbi:MAG: NAD kinase, partial [Propionibacteriaceae bacterium]|nr:NAD kinase [Propionibacteriaceae bacterium]